MEFDLINVGDEAEIVHQISEKDVDAFVQLTGDDNPLHIDDGYAATTTFKKRVVHGMLTASFISTMIGTKLPGKGALWFEQHICFLAPVRIGETIKVWAKVKHKSVAQRILVLETVVFGDGDRRVIEGEAKVKVLETEKKRVKTMMDNEKGAIIVTGAGRGIGAAIAKELASVGYPVVVNFSSSKEAAQNVAMEIRNNGGSALAIGADVTVQQDVRDMVDQTIKEFGKIYGLVNNASAPTLPRDFTELSWEDFQKAIDVQIKGAFHLSQTVLPYLLEQKQGSIVNISSIFADNVPPVKLAPYNTVKAALIAMSKSLAVEYGPQGIRVNCVSPGMTQTDFIANVPEKVKMMTKMQTPLRSLAIPEEIAGTVAFLFSDKASFITGQNIRVCGGIVME